MSYIDDIMAYVPGSPAEAADKEQILNYVNLFPNTILTRENPIAHFTASGFILSPDGKQVLLAHHNLMDLWAWTGGHNDGDPDMLRVALKEAREETGDEHIWPLSEKIADLEILPVWGHEKRGKQLPTHLHLNVAYLLLADPADPVHHREGENSKVAWFPVERMLEVTNEWQMVPVYTRLLERARALLGK